MFLFLTGTVIGLAIGWNLPQPQWAKDLQAKVTNYFKPKL